jgi:hypothetical protein
MNGGFIALFPMLGRRRSSRGMIQSCLAAFADFGLGRAIVALRD